MSIYQKTHVRAEGVTTFDTEQLLIRFPVAVVILQS